MKLSAKKKWILILIGLAALLIVAGVVVWRLTPPPQVEEEEERSYSTSFDAESGTLTITGTGMVEDLYPRDVYNGLVWGDTVIAVDTTVRHIVIGEGITRIFNSFNDLHCLEDIVFPETLTEIDTSFIDCDRLVRLDFHPAMIAIRHNSFYDCDGLKEIRFSSEIMIKDAGHSSDPFGNLDSLTEIHIPGGSHLSSAFIGCPQLKKVLLGPGEVGIARALFTDIDRSVHESFSECHEDLKIYATKTDRIFYDSVPVDPIVVSEEELLSMIQNEG